MKAIIITGGDVCDYQFYAKYFNDANVVICADGGVRHLINFRVQADYFLGDFDSCDFEKVKNSEFLKSAKIIKFKAEKDETDTEIALNLAINNGYDEIIIIGAIGSRFDHTLSNVFLLKKAVKSCVNAVIVNEKNEIRIIDKSIKLNPVKESFLSLIALEKTENLTLKNLKYELEGYSLETGTSIGISNEFVGKEASITFDSGMLLVMITSD